MKISDLIPVTDIQGGFPRETLCESSGANLSKLLFHATFVIEKRSFCNLPGGYWILDPIRDMQFDDTRIPNLVIIHHVKTLVVLEVQ